MQMLRQAAAEAAFIARRADRVRQDRDRGRATRSAGSLCGPDLERSHAAMTVSHEAAAAAPRACMRLICLARILLLRLSRLAAEGAARLRRPSLAVPGFLFDLRLNVREHPS